MDAGDAGFELYLLKWRGYIAVKMTSSRHLTTLLLYRRGFGALLNHARGQKILSPLPYGERWALYRVWLAPPRRQAS